MQILPRAQSFSEEFSRKVGEGIGSGFSQGIKNRKEQLANAQQDKKLSEMIGMDVSGFTPEMKQAVLVETLKQQGKNKLQSQKQGFLDSILGGGQRQNQNPQDMMSEEQMMQNTEQGQMGQDGQIQRQGGFDASKISDADIARANAIDPALGRELRAAKDTGLREKRLEKESSPEYRRSKLLTEEQAKADISYHKGLQESTKKTVMKNESLERIEKLVKKGASGKIIDKVMENIGLMAKTPEQRRELAAEVKNQYTDFKEVAGSQLSAQEFFILSGAYPNPDFSPEANASIIKNLKIVNDTKLQEDKIARDIVKANGGKIPENFQSRVNEKLFDYIASRKQEMKDNLNKVMYDQYKVPKGKTLMFVNGDPEQPLYVNPEEIEEAMSMGAEEP